MEWLKDNKQLLQWITFLLVLLSFPVINYGVRESLPVAVIGLLMVIIGFLIPPAMRFLAEG